MSRQPYFARSLFAGVGIGIPTLGLAYLMISGWVGGGPPEAPGAVAILLFFLVFGLCILASLVSVGLAAWRVRRGKMLAGMAYWKTAGIAYGVVAVVTAVVLAFLAANASTSESRRDAYFGCMLTRSEAGMYAACLRQHSLSFDNPMVVSSMMEILVDKDPTLADDLIRGLVQDKQWMGSCMESRALVAAYRGDLHGITSALRQSTDRGDTSFQLLVNSLPHAAILGNQPEAFVRAMEIYIREDSNPSRVSNYYNGSSQIAARLKKMDAEARERFLAPLSQSHPDWAKDLRARTIDHLKLNTGDAQETKPPDLVKDEAKEIFAIMERRELELQPCFDREMKAKDAAERDNFMEGTTSRLPQVTLEVTILRDGRVKRATVESSNVDNPKVEKCVAQQVSTWRFPRLTKRPKKVFGFTFEFRGAFQDY